MLFNSIHFLIFLPIVVFIYFSIKQRYRWILLLLASYYFYMSWKPEYAILILISTLVDYVAGLCMSKFEDKNKRKPFLILSLFTNLGLLFAFKYFNFVSTSISEVLKLFSINFSTPLLNFLLPVGISFYTFQTLSYTIDVYNSKIKPEKHFGIFAVYVSFFPQLVAGPIERAKNLLPQFFQKHKFEYNRMRSGILLMLWGFFKKIVIADRLSLITDMIYGNLYDYNAIPLILSTVLFSFQIYCDFSGYSDIAIGSARILGYDLMQNFRRPFFSKSISELWRRWHISLSSWFQDYVFTPLYLFVSKIKPLKNLSYIIRHNLAFMISMLIGLSLLGLWHGANWTFVLFGVYNGIFVSTYHLTKKFWDKVPVFVKIFLTFLIFSVGLIFFRANNINEISYIFTHFFVWEFKFSSINIGVGWDDLIIALLSISLLIVIEFMQEYKLGKKLYEKPVYIRWIIYILLILAILIFGIFKIKPFIYFQF